MQPYFLSSGFESGNLDLILQVILRCGAEWQPTPFQHLACVDVHFHGCDPPTHFQAQQQLAQSEAQYQAQNEMLRQQIPFSKNY